MSSQQDFSLPVPPSTVAVLETGILPTTPRVSFVVVPVAVCLSALWFSRERPSVGIGGDEGSEVSNFAASSRL